MSLTMKEKILNAAEKRVRGAGFAEMSFRDLASDVGIKSASVHYHFPTKPDLGEALVDRYASQFKEKLDKIELDDLPTALQEFVGLYSQALVLNESICLCAIMGAEAIGLPESVNQRTKAFFEMNKAWLEALFADHNVENTKDTASMIVAALEGGMIVASASNNRAMFEQVATAAMGSVTKT
ncbi:MAG: TetR/AcrR family transcriptional regulator [Pseudomonadota bacterium]